MNFYFHKIKQILEIFLCMAKDFPKYLTTAGFLFCVRKVQQSILPLCMNLLSRSFKQENLLSEHQVVPFGAQVKL